MTAPTHHDLATTLRQQAATDDARRLAALLGRLNDTGLRMKCDGGARLVEARDLPVVLKAIEEDRL